MSDVTLHPETLQPITVSATQRQRLNHAKDMFAVGKLAQAAAIRAIFDEQLYVIEGYANKKQYCEDVLQISSRQGEMLYRVATTFGVTIDSKPEAQTFALSDTNSEQGVLSLPFTKLYEITRLNEEERKTLDTEGHFTDADGNRVTLDEINRMSQRKLNEIIKEKTSKLRERAEALAEDNLELKNTVERLKTENKILTQKTEIAAELEDRFGSVARRLEEKRRYIADAKRLLAEAHDRIVRAGITPQDAVTDIQEISNFLGQLDLTANIVRNHYMPAIEVLISHA